MITGKYAKSVFFILVNFLVFNLCSFEGIPDGFFHPQVFLSGYFFVLCPFLWGGQIKSVDLFVIKSKGIPIPEHFDIQKSTPSGVISVYFSSVPKNWGFFD